MKRLRRRMARKEPRFADGDVFTVPLGDGRTYLAWAIANPSYVNTYIVVFDLIINEEEAESRVDEALSAKPLLAGIVILPANSADGTNCWRVGHRDLTIRDKNRFFPAIYAPTDNGFIEDIMGQRRRPALPHEQRIPPGPYVDESYREKNPEVLFISSRRSYSFMAFVNALKSLNGMIPWTSRVVQLDANKVVLAKDVLGPLKPGS